jgi:arginase family enzyme
MTPLDELAALLRPAGGGLFLVSTGRAEQLVMQQRLYGVTDEAGVEDGFRRNLAAIAGARAVVLGCPSDVGAGFLRGANVGPQAIRSALLADPDWPARAAAAGVVDIGDVFVVPQLLHDDMLSAGQLAATRRALYGHLPEETAARLPVSPLSIAERALDLVFQLNPDVVPVVLGGDHSNAWPVAATLARHRRDRWAIVQPDAHTDLLPERLGVKICFATWSYHANELLGRDGRLVQVGVRASRHARGHWEQELGVRQFWADEVRADPAGAIQAILDHLAERGVTSVYFSNDIDGTDSAWADAAGTPESGGLEPDFVVELIRALGRRFRLCAADVVEVAPPLAPDGGEKTVALAVRYLRESLAAIAGPDLAP